MFLSVLPCIQIWGVSVACSFVEKYKKSRTVADDFFLVLRLSVLKPNKESIIIRETESL